MDYCKEIIVHLLKAGASVGRLAWACGLISRDAPRPNLSVVLCHALIQTGYSITYRDLYNQSPRLNRLSYICEIAMYQLTRREKLHPPSLQRLSRVAIRRQLSSANKHRSILPGIEKLPLPEEIRRYLMLKGVHSEVDLTTIWEGSSCPLDYMD